MSSHLVSIVDDEPAVRKLLEYQFKFAWGHQVRLYEDGESFLAGLDDQPDLVILDVMMPGMDGVQTLREIKRRDPDLPVIVLSAQASVETAIQLLKLGALDYLSKPVDVTKLEAATKSAFQIRDLSREVRNLRERMMSNVQFDNIISSHGEMQEVFRLVQKVKDSDIVVLVMGESGTGKELIARAVHYNGKRKDGPFIVVNCASIPPDLMESELFGHDKGAFTGAHQRRIGKFESANGGTIFLDEIGELDLALQAKLLRVIQTKTFERVGGNESLTVDVRIISATNRDLKKDVQETRFREDLYYRLATFPIVLPPLRSRRSDILLLAEHFLKKFSEQEGKHVKRFSRSVLQTMFAYPWPGNVRELENAIQRAVVIADGDTLTEKEMPVALQSYASNGANGSENVMNPPSSEPGAVMPMERLKENAIRNAIRLCNGNSVLAARKLGIGRATLYRLMKKYEVR
ncbi:MAG: sigma-54-dependent Fis family transcriptional regulator [Ignavibacteria bacterium GWA2_55_11]|nr:MAG: sigma-54-dependent Fis family transcriptional regulator [Ignavibacteria bacterium GWA2_55_11]OGU44250.1 MAG: sigma-54-dependent Fis family transcriptional regulator [Ignavibacteria bacterium GWC2_56_12]OGU63349.1 MAG: sigma-54-dependent Fis family transcriptional regulator [Ignavibacteria bacterium RIFCSPHIGHO2_02_FULL_56_12]OGU69589.1 MAG: sigma-54-dependent Fis family transcriptional regulator [Ignavibacteria bacterium RIFCSPLOWO2_02_FULL_55_14]OGU71488.1 MAG: sigma-54-dependent Fis f